MEAVLHGKLRTYNTNFNQAKKQFVPQLESNILLACGLHMIHHQPIDLHPSKITIRHKPASIEMIQRH